LLTQREAKNSQKIPSPCCACLFEFLGGQCQKLNSILPRVPPNKLFCTADQRLNFFLGEPNFFALDRKFRGCCTTAHYTERKKEFVVVSEHDEDGLGLFGFLPTHIFFDKYLPKRLGSTPRTQRSEQHLVQRLRLPVIKVGVVTLIDVAGAARRLRELLPDAAARRPGRPKGSRNGVKK
jgi:hypothetical protein